ncbi:MAG: queuosine precursor transporter [Desulfobacteraceae bacterium]|nr:queuosine precursor transporter [Desulfobacteraceae bacterium]
MELYISIFGILITLMLVCFAAYLAKKYGFEIIAAIYAVLVATGSILAAKMVTFGVFSVPAAIIVASATFFVTDIICELWGKQYAKKAVMAGILGLIILSVSQYIAISWPSTIESSIKYDEVMAQTPRIAIASFLAYVISQFLDVNVFHRVKNLTKGRFLWIRNNGSTFFSQIVDTIAFILIAFYGTFPNQQLISIIFGMISVKLFIALLDTPFLYIAVWMLKGKNEAELNDTAHL